MVVVNSKELLTVGKQMAKVAGVPGGNEFLGQVDSVIKNIKELMTMVNMAKGLNQSPQQSPVKDDASRADPADSTRKPTDNQMIINLLTYASNVLSARESSGAGPEPIGGLIANLPYTVSQCNQALKILLSRIK